MTEGEYFSIFGDVKKCYVTGDADGVVVHHIFGGPYKAASERHGFVIGLRKDWHTVSPYSVHEDVEFSNRLKEKCQKYAENKEGMDREDFVKEFGRSYL